jgi:surface polysaccharide O-acyltransferase-like enzyme
MIRIRSVDFVRAVAILAVITIHTSPFLYAKDSEGVELILWIAINQACRFAVPCFFVLSGYFFAKKLNSTNHSSYLVTAKSLSHIGFIFLFWSLIYFFPTDIRHALASGDHMSDLKAFSISRFDSLMQSPVHLLLEGTMGHLWFLSSLFCCVLICFALKFINRESLMLPVGLAMLFLALLGKPYANTPIGFVSEFNFRNGPFFGFLFFSVGYFLSKKNNQKEWLFWGVVLVIIGTIFHFFEIFILYKYFSTQPFQDYVAGTVFSGLGAALIALSRSSRLGNSLTSFAGPLTLGVYGIHILVIQLTSSAMSELQKTVPGTLIFPLIVFFVSVAISACMAKWAPTKRLVS